MIKKKALLYRIIYAICFLGLMVIDWTRGSQRGVVWEMTVNFTGVIIAILLLSWAEWKRFLHPIYGVWTVIGIAAVPLSIKWWETHQTVIYRDKLWSAVLSVWLLGYFTIYVCRYWKGKELLRRLTANKSYSVLYGMLFWMFFSLNEDIWPIWYLWMVLLIVAMPKTEIQVSAIQKGMIDGIIASFFLLQGLAFVFRPFDARDYRYVGMYANTNMNALFYCIVLFAFLVRLYEVEKNQNPKWQQVLLFLLITGTCGFMAMTVCRTSFMTAFVLLVVYVILVDFYLLKKTARQVLVRFAAFIICVVVMLPVTYSVARYLPPLFHHPIWFEGEYDEEKVHSWDPIDSYKYVKFTDVLKQLHLRTDGLEKLLPPGMATMKSYALELFVEEEPEETNYQPGGITLGNRFYAYGSEELLAHETAIARLSIWEHYLKNGTIWGHSKEMGHSTGMYGITWHGQNVFVQFWFYYGIPSAVLYLVWIILNFITGCKTAGEEHNDGVILALSTVVVFTFGLFEATWYPAQMVLFLLVFTMVLSVEYKET